MPTNFLSRFPFFDPTGEISYHQCVLSFVVFSHSSIFLVSVGLYDFNLQIYLGVVLGPMQYFYSYFTYTDTILKVFSLFSSSSNFSADDMAMFIFILHLDLTKRFVAPFTVLTS